jgi:caa(3)-type oxidase subunit IV
MESAFKTVNRVFAALIILTLATVGAGMIHLGRESAILTALAIAAAKVSLIGWFFMGLRSENRALQTFVTLALLAVGILSIGIFPDVGR